ncbi:MAG: hypothetical protein ACJA2S_001716 [Cyclobacteriaceae bacterium]|jgi:hypothetical protein
MNYKNIFLLAIVLVFLSIISCKDQLEEAVYSELLASNAYETVEDAESLVISIYASLRGTDWGTYYEHDYLQLSELPTDYGQDLWDGGSNALETGTWSNIQGESTNLWEGAYGVIASANFAIQILGGMTIEEDVRAGYIAEAKFLRALAYYDLTFNFGDVILNIGESSGDLGLSPQADVIAQIVQDLTEAADVLPGFTTNGVSRATRGAALGLRAKTNLNAKNWTAAAADAQSVIDLGQYDLHSSATELFHVANVRDNEWVFVLMTKDAGAAAVSQLAWHTLDGSYQAGGWGNLAVTDEFYNSFDMNDARRSNLANGYQDDDKTVNDEGLFQHHAIPGTPEHTNLTADPTVYVTDKDFAPIVKYLGGNDRFSGSPADYGVNYPILRYADILLTKAEALNETGDQSGAMAAVNQIRTRAGLADLSGLDQVDLSNAILEERGKELFMEGHRRIDLVRSGKHAELWRAGLEAKYPGENFGHVDATKSVFPIPQSEVDSNSQLGNSGSN